MRFLYIVIFLFVHFRFVLVVFVIVNGGKQIIGFFQRGNYLLFLQGNEAEYRSPSGALLLGGAALPALR